MRRSSSRTTVSLFAAGALLSSAGMLEAQSLGGISRCPAAAQIAAAATHAALQNNTGLNARQSSAVVTTVVRQASQSAPYAAADICTASMQVIHQVVLASASRGNTPQGNLTHNQVAELPPEAAITTADGYRKMTKAVVQGAIDGCVSSGLGAEGLQQLITAVANSMVKDAASQAAVTAVATKNGTADPTHGLPMDTVAEGTTVTKALVGTIVQVALDNGFSAKEVTAAVNRSASAAITTAQNIGSTMQNELAGSAAAGVASQVANEVATSAAKAVATAIAADIQSHVDTKTLSTAATDPTDNTPTTTQNQNQNVNTPTTTPGDQSRVTIPRIIPTPTPASGGGFK